jgi:hypothetical protein
MLPATETVLRMRDEPVPTWCSRVLAVWLLRQSTRRRLCACLANGGEGFNMPAVPHMVAHGFSTFPTEPTALSKAHVARPSLWMWSSSSLPTAASSRLRPARAPAGGGERQRRKGVSKEGGQEMGTTWGSWRAGGLGGGKGGHGGEGFRDDHVFAHSSKTLIAGCSLMSGGRTSIGIHGHPRRT